MNRIISLASVTLVLVSTPMSAQKQPRHSGPSQPSTVAAPQWRKVYADSKVVVSIDPHGTIKHEDGTYTTHMRWAYTADQPIGSGKNYRVMRDIRLLDCKSLGTKTITAYVFDATGKQVSSFDTAPKDVQDLPWDKRRPGTPSANALARVCQSLSK